MPTRLHRRGRYAHLAEIRTLDPTTPEDRDRIAWLTSRHEFPWDYAQGTGVAFLRDYGVPSIARLLDHTREFEDHGVKRYDDTLLFAEESTVEGVDSPRAHTATRRLNRIHGHYDIPDHEFQYVLATTLVGPVRWIDQYGWRPLDRKEVVALTGVTTRFGELMGIKGLPATYDGYLELLASYERAHFAFDPANKRVTDATIAIGRATAPWFLRPLTRRVTIALMDEPLRTALGMERQPAWLVRAVRRGLRLRAHLLRHLAPPRREAFHHRPTSYPQGYRLGDIGPASMLDELNTKERSLA